MITFAKPQTNAKSRRSGTVQRKCVCTGTPGPTGERERCRKKRGSEPLGHRGGHDFGRIAVGLQRKLAINRLGDRFEQEADRMAEYAVNGAGSIAHGS